MTEDEAKDEYEAFMSAASRMIWVYLYPSTASTEERKAAQKAYEPWSVKLKGSTGDH